MYTNEQLERNFTYHAPKADQPERYQRLRQAAKLAAFAIRDFAALIDRICPDSRETQIALDQLDPNRKILEIEQATFWANASIARNE